MTPPSKGELVLRHLSQTLNATRRELKELVRITRDKALCQLYDGPSDNSAGRIDRSNTATNSTSISATLYRSIKTDERH